MRVRLIFVKVQLRYGGHSEHFIAPPRTWHKYYVVDKMKLGCQRRYWGHCMWLISPARRLPRFAPRFGNRRWHSRTFAPPHTTDQYDSPSVDAMLIIHCHLFLSSVDFYWLLICLSFWSSTGHCVFTSYASFWKPVFPAITIVTAFEFYHLLVASRNGSDLSLLHVLGIRTMCCLWLSIVYSVAW